MSSAATGYDMSTAADERCGWRCALSCSHEWTAVLAVGKQLQRSNIPPSVQPDGRCASHAGKGKNACARPGRPRPTHTQRPTGPGPGAGRGVDRPTRATRATDGSSRLVGVVEQLPYADHLAITKAGSRLRLFCVSGQFMRRNGRAGGRRAGSASLPACYVRRKQVGRRGALGMWGQSVITLYRLGCGIPSVGVFPRQQQGVFPRRQQSV